MLASELSEIEAQLGIVLPKGYGELMQARGDELRVCGCFAAELSSVFLDPREVIRFNQLERPANSGTGCAFPDWWKTFVLIGTNGGGDFYCLRLDEQPGLWMIGSDCGDEPTFIAKSLTDFIDERIREYRAEQERERQRTAVYGEELAAELKAVGPDLTSTAAQWMTLPSCYRMFHALDGLGRKVSARKMRLFGLACCGRLTEDQLDADGVRGRELAEQLVTGTAPLDEVARLRERLKGRFLGTVAADKQMTLDLSAIKNLLQDDQDYLNEAPIYAGDADLSRVWNTVESAMRGQQPAVVTLEDLLREVLGNPFQPLKFDPQWRTPEVVALAQRIHDDQAFDQMPQLPDVLANAGCTEPRILAHCRRTVGHVRGCWVLDQILQLEPEPAVEAFTWDFHWPHPTIDADKLKERLQAFGLDSPGDDKRVDDRAALRFADWLQTEGDPVWSKYVRLRCQLDGKSPPDNYADLIEALQETAAAMKFARAEFEGLYFKGYSFANDEWWEDDVPDLERGLPSIVHAVKPSKGEGPVATLLQRIDALVRRTPVRGVKFDDHYPGTMGEILNSAGGRALRGLWFKNQHEPDKGGPVIEAVVQSPAVQTLERLSIQNGIPSDQDADVLAGAAFGRLRQLDLPAYKPITCSPEAMTRLMSAPWFRRLERLHIGFNETCCESGMRLLSGMPALHTLTLWNPPAKLLLGSKDAADFPALRRLYINHADLSGESGAAFRRWHAPRLIELWLEDAKGKADDFRALIESPLFECLQVLSFGGRGQREATLAALAGTPCAKGLRILRLHCGGSNCVGTYRSLSRTALAIPGAFPELTTLHIEYPFSKAAQRDTAEFLSRAASPQLRHLTLKDVDFDNDCAVALASNPAFAHLTRLQIDQGYEAMEKLSPQELIRLLRSANLQHLIALKLSNFAVGNAVEQLADKTLLPNLKSGGLWGTNASPATSERLKRVRPEIHVGS